MAVRQLYLTLRETVPTKSPSKRRQIQRLKECLKAAKGLHTPDSCKLQVLSEESAGPGPVESVCRSGGGGRENLLNLLPHSRRPIKFGLVNADLFQRWGPMFCSASLLATIHLSLQQRVAAFRSFFFWLFSCGLECPRTSSLRRSRLFSTAGH